MIANSNSLILTIDVDDKGTLKVRQFAGEVDKSGKASTAATAAMGRGYDEAGAKLTRLTGLAGNLISAFAACKLTQVTKDAVNAASDMEEMQSKFDVVFKARDEFELAGIGQSRLEEFTAGRRDWNALARMEYERRQVIATEQDRSWLAQAESDRTNLSKKLAEYEKAYAGILNLTGRTAEAMQRNFSNLFFDAMTGKLRSLSDYANAIFESIARMASDLMAQQATRALFGNNFQGGGLLAKLYDYMFGYDINSPTSANKALPFHSGGMIGNSGGDPRMIPAWMIATAPRLHNGLAPDEYPAVLQYGERVQSRREVAAERMAASESKVQVIVNNNSREQATVAESRGPDGTRQIEIMIGNMLVNGGPATQALKNGYGLKRLGR